jgi:hypothetical protein
MILFLIPEDKLVTAAEPVFSQEQVTSIAGRESSAGTSAL